MPARLVSAGPADRPGDPREAAMTLYSTCDAPVGTVPADHAVVRPRPEAAEGWEALALAELGRLLTPAELDVAHTLPAADVLDRLFPGLCDAARHEALCALG